MLRVLIGIVIGVALMMGIISVDWDKALQVKHTIQNEIHQFQK